MKSEVTFTVACRFRPLNSQEKAKGDMIDMEKSEDGKTIYVANPSKNNKSGLKSSYTFDHIFYSDSSQESIYNTVAKPILIDVLNGYNGIVFAYGQTSSGKTYTMSGLDTRDPNTKGVIPRLITDIFNMVKLSNEELLYEIKVSFCEIYLGKIYDLIDISPKDLKIQEDKNKGVYISNLTEDYVGNQNELLDLMEKAKNNRKTGETLMNTTSSRSHFLFICNIKQTKTEDSSEKTSNLLLVDLAGHEDIKKTSAKGKVLDEANDINLSLLSLGMVIRSLASKQSYINYKNSVLTRVLQKSLSGTSKTALIITCSPSPSNLPETIRTLEFGVSCKSIKIKPKININYSVSFLKAEIEKNKDYIQILENQNKELKTILEQYKDNKQKSNQMNLRETLEIREQEIEDLRKKNYFLVQSIATIKSSFEKYKNSDADFNSINEIEHVLRSTDYISFKSMEINSSDESNMSELADLRSKNDILMQRNLEISKELKDLKDQKDQNDHFIKNKNSPINEPENKKLKAKYESLLSNINLIKSNLEHFKVSPESFGLLDDIENIIKNSEDLDQAFDIEANEEDSVEINDLKDQLKMTNERNNNLVNEIKKLKAANDYYSSQNSSLEASKSRLEFSVSELSDQIEDIKLLNLKLQQDLQSNPSSYQSPPESILRNIVQPSRTDVNDLFKKEFDLYQDFEQKLLEAEELLESKIKSGEDPTGIRTLVLNALEKDLSENRLSQIKVSIKTYADKIWELENVDVQSQQSKQIQELYNLYDKQLAMKASYSLENLLLSQKITRLHKIISDKDDEINKLKNKVSTDLSSSFLNALGNKLTEVRSNPSKIKKVVKAGSKYFAGVGANISNTTFGQNLLKYINK
jgi:kinesin family member 5